MIQNAPSRARRVRITFVPLQVTAKCPNCSLHPSFNTAFKPGICSANSPKCARPRQPPLTCGMTPKNELYLHFLSSSKSRCIFADGVHPTALILSEDNPLPYPGVILPPLISKSTPFGGKATGAACIFPESLL